MSKDLTAAQTAAALKDGVGGFGFSWMADDATRERGKAELGLRGRAWYHLGRAGVLGDAPWQVVHAVEAFFPAAVIQEHWQQGRALVEPGVAAAAYAACCADVGRARFADTADTRRAADLVATAVDSVDVVGQPLFAGWRALARPDDAPGRLALLLNVLREHRGSVHAAAVAAVGLGPLEAIVAGSYGAGNARFFQWPEPYPDPAPYRAAWQQAEDLTSAAAARPYETLRASERGELVDLLTVALGAL